MTGDARNLSSIESYQLVQLFQKLNIKVKELCGELMNTQIMYLSY